MKITEVNDKTIVIKGDTDEEYIDILDATKEAICKVAPDCGVTIKVSFGLKDEDSDKKIIIKELSIKEKAKAYDDRLEKAKKWYDANTNEGYRGIFEDIFPELKAQKGE